MDIVGDYKTTLEQLRATKEFLIQLNPKDFELRSMINSIDAKINKNEESVRAFIRKVEAHRCGMCDRPYDEEEPKMVGHFKVCPHCREQSSKYKVGSEWERIYGLPAGTIKRDCLSKDGKPAKLQPFIDCGLIDISGVHNYVHKVVIEMYYLNPDIYKRRSSRKS